MNDIETGNIDLINDVSLNTAYIPNEPERCYLIRLQVALKKNIINYIKIKKDTDFFKDYVSNLRMDTT